MQEEPSFGGFGQLVILRGRPDCKLLLDIQCSIIAYIVLGISFGCLGVSGVVQMSLSYLHRFEQHCLFGCTLLDYALAIFGKLVCLVQQPISDIGMWMTSINEEFLYVNNTP